MGQRKKIAVNTRFLIKNKLEGIGLFTYESLKYITQNHTDTDFHFLFDRQPDPSFIFGENVKPVVLFPQARHPFLWYWWFELSVARWLKRNKPDLFLSTDGFACLHTNVPQVLVIHDLAFEHYDDHISGLVRRYYRYFTPRYAQKAERIATVSEFSKNDIVKLYGIDATKIDVVYNGVKKVYQPISSELKTAAKRKYSSGSDYFLYVGAIHPRKNIKRLLLAFDQFKTATGSNFKLLLAGRKAWAVDEMEATFGQMKYGSDVVFLGHTGPGELAAITASAYALVYVSLFEGFGIPIIEAMSSGVPVITSNVSSMPEVAGEAALTVNPQLVDEIAHAMIQLAQDTALREALIKKGNERVQLFSWEQTGKRLWDCCERVMK